MSRQISGPWLLQRAGNNGRLIEAEDWNRLCDIVEALGAAEQERTEHANALPLAVVAMMASGHTSRHVSRRGLLGLNHFFGKAKNKGQPMSEKVNGFPDDPRIAKHLAARRAGCECPWRWSSDDIEPVRLCWPFSRPCPVHPGDWFNEATGQTAQDWEKRQS